MPKLKRRKQLRKGKRRIKHPKARRRRWAVRMLVSKTGGLCEYCGKTTTRDDDDPLRMTIDHVVPVSQGGDDRPENLRLACRRCNEEKGDGIAVDVYLACGDFAD
jgi:5-methylcytosine-specific restriction endonuclease McrA